MAHTSLYRTYRPQTFDDVVGQSHVTRTLKNAVAEGTVAHAYLFTGPRGTGKSFVFREISPYAILISGGQTTVAQLFINLSTGRIGLVGLWDVVALSGETVLPSTQT